MTFLFYKSRYIIFYHLISIGFHSSTRKNVVQVGPVSVRTAGCGTAHDGVRGHQKSAAYGQLQPHCNTRATFNSAHTAYILFSDQFIGTFFSIGCFTLKHYFESYKHLVYFTERKRALESVQCLNQRKF